MNDIDLPAIASRVVWGGALLGAVFGFVGARTNFCTMGAVSDIVTMGDWNRMRMWALAMAVAVLGLGGLEAAGLVKATQSIYTGPNLAWLSHIVGGLLFGFGMVLGSGCASKTLMRIGGGNLKSLLVAIVLAVTAYATMRGVLAPLRVGVLDGVAIPLGTAQDLASLLAKASGVARGSLQIGCALVVGVGLALFALRSRDARTQDVLDGGIVVGLLVVGGWWLTGVAGHLEEHPQTLEEAWIATSSGRMESLTFVGPQASVLDLALLWTDRSRFVSFGVATVLGVVVGAFVHGLVTRTLRLEGFRDPEDMLNHIVAAMLMGFGGVTALGCTVGQGITGLSTLAVGSMLTLVSILVGAVAALRYQTWRFERQMALEEAAA